MPNTQFHYFFFEKTAKKKYLVGRGCDGGVAADMVMKQWSESVRPTIVVDTVARWLPLRR